jgi:hypothetical protein
VTFEVDFFLFFFLITTSRPNLLVGRSGETEPVATNYATLVLTAHEERQRKEITSQVSLKMIPPLFRS